MVGTVISVVDSGGMPAEKSIRGSKEGFTARVAAQFAKAKAVWLNPRAMQTPMTHR
ncbi:MAG: hypothetical protein PHC61_14615 [Chitinivibrionales bacterium]|nr:hypothetical protein [Chitinivibrionales bacterium]